MTSRVPIGQLLVQQGHIDDWQLQSALGFQRRWGCRIGRALIHLGMVSERVLMTEIARQHGVPFVDLADLYVAPEIVQSVPEKLIRKHKFFPIALGSDSRRGLLIVATSEPQNLPMLDEIAFATGRTVKAAMASEQDLELCIGRHLDGPKGSDWNGDNAVLPRYVS